MKKLYRHEIDGLRAIAVFAVILYHSNFIIFGRQFFSGGFFGVDIFFVISGYLITTLVLEELINTNKFCFKTFFLRRIRRILPALLLVVIISSIIGYFILFRDSLIDLANSIISVIFFGSNFYFHYTNSTYGTQDTLLKPLLHTWSLSVEEQFYILLPIFLLFLYKFCKKYIFKILIFFFFISLFFAEYNSRVHSSFNFYMLPSRLFELIAGSILYYLKLRETLIKHKYIYILSKISPYVGMILIIGSFLLINYNAIYHPSFITLIPITGVSFVILSNDKQFIVKVLKKRFLVFFGLISYSLYLFHYPVFAYLRYLYMFDTTWIKLVAIFFIVIISIISYFFIEKPFRTKNLISVRKLIIYCSIIIFFIAIFFMCIYKIRNIKKILPNIFSEEMIDLSIDKTEFYDKNTDGTDVFLIGDSFSGSIKLKLNEELKNNSYNFFSFKNCCGWPYQVPIFNSKKTKSDGREKNDENINNFLKTNKNLIVIYYEAWNEDSLERIKESINNIMKQGHVLILVYPAPIMEFHVPRKIFSEYLIKKVINLFNKDTIYDSYEILKIDYENYRVKNKKIIDTFDKIEYSNIYRVYPDKSFCNTIVKNKCVANSQLHLFYYDSHHLSLKGSEYVVSDIIKLINQIKNNKN
jgi:peptidoglycan/LPS O-acetylase OafA/YrhL